MALDPLEYSYQKDELKRWGFNIIKSLAGMYSSYAIVMVEYEDLFLIPLIVRILTIPVLVIAPIALIRSVYRFFKALIKPAKL